MMVWLSPNQSWFEVILLYSSVLEKFDHYRDITVYRDTFGHNNCSMKIWYWHIATVGDRKWHDQDQGPDGPSESRSPDPEVKALGLGFSSCHALMGLALCCCDYLSWMDLISIWWGLELRVGRSGGSHCLLSGRVSSQPGIENRKFLSSRQIGG